MKAHRPTIIKEVMELWNDNETMVDGHYQLPVPWKSDVQIPNNMMVAVYRLNSLKISLKKKTRS